MNPEDVPRECFADGRPEADPPMHTSFFILGSESDKPFQEKH